MLVTLVRDHGSPLLLGALDEVGAHAGRDSADEAQLPLPMPAPGANAKRLTVEMPYTTQGAKILAPVLLHWRMARQGRSVTLTMEDGSRTEIAELSVARIEWMLPVVSHIEIVDRPRAAAPAA